MTISVNIVGLSYLNIRFSKKEKKKKKKLCNSSYVISAKNKKKELTSYKHFQFHIPEELLEDEE